MLAPPEHFGIVEDDVYRCTEIDPLNFPFLQTLSLKTILSIGQQKPSPAVDLFARENNISIKHMKLPSWKISEEEWKLLPDKVAEASLSYVLNIKNYPILIIDLSCTFIGVLRKLEHWTLSSIINEYREISFDRSQYLYELYIEMVDLSKISIPRLRLAADPASQSSLDSTSSCRTYNGATVTIDFDRLPQSLDILPASPPDEQAEESSDWKSFPIDLLPAWYIESECMWLDDMARYQRAANST
ncbi:tyrosine phosphatase family-domain-containing protein [Myxozyma melibiosi]|uniref:Tyrosine phosphatase family-domain-containing protein n=1 Tax=Myxozyma melibiosi TaxID=54550 RepID=A0ABR1F8N2_9ASCO